VIGGIETIAITKGVFDMKKRRFVIEETVEVSYPLINEPPVRFDVMLKRFQEENPLDENNWGLVRITPTVRYGGFVDSIDQFFEEVYSLAKDKGINIVNVLVDMAVTKLIEEYKLAISEKEIKEE